MQLCKQETPKNAAQCKRRDQQMKEDKICISKLAHDKKCIPESLHAYLRR